MVSANTPSLKADPQLCISSRVLTYELGAASLLGILEGTLPHLQTFASYYSSFKSTILIGSQTEIFTVDALTSEIGAFSMFIKFIMGMVLLAALDLNACELEQLITLATSLSLRVGAEHRSSVLRMNLIAALCWTR